MNDFNYVIIDLSNYEPLSKYCKMIFFYHETKKFAPNESFFQVLQPKSHT